MTGDVGCVEGETRSIVLGSVVLERGEEDVRRRNLEILRCFRAIELSGSQSQRRRAARAWLELIPGSK